MMDYLVKHFDDLGEAVTEHLLIVAAALLLSLLIASALTVLGTYSRIVSEGMLGLFSMIYSVPSLAMFALLIPLTGLGKTTAVVVLVIYNQYLLLRNFLAGLDGVDAGIVEAAAGMGMTKMQILVKIKLPLAKPALAAGIRIASVSTVSIAVIAASINAGGLGTILFDGLRTMNYAKIFWGSAASAFLAFFFDSLLGFFEKKVQGGVQ